MKAHELNTLMHDIAHRLKEDYPALEFITEVNENELFLDVTYPDGIRSRLHANLSEKDEVIAQPTFHSAGNGGTEVRNDSRYQEVNRKFISMLQEEIKKNGFEYFYDEIGGEGG